MYGSRQRGISQTYPWQIQHPGRPSLKDIETCSDRIGCLSQTIANLVFSVTGYHNIDLFATRLNNRLSMYVSPIRDSKALAIDTLSISWDYIHGYAFPPFHVIPHSPLRLPPTFQTFGSTRRETCASKPSNACPSHRGIIKQSITDRKFSREVAEHISAARLSTRKVYDGKWTVFTNWCPQREINPVLASPRIIADFLLHMFEEKKCHYH